MFREAHNMRSCREPIGADLNQPSISSLVIFGDPLAFFCPVGRRRPRNGSLGLAISVRTRANPLTLSFTVPIDETAGPSHPQHLDHASPPLLLRELRSDSLPPSSIQRTSTNGGSRMGLRAAPSAQHRRALADLYFLFFDGVRYKPRPPMWPGPDECTERIFRRGQLSASPPRCQRSRASL
jgi:hypothetical protein